MSNSAVPHLTLNMGASYGAGNYGMSGRAYKPRFVFTWPNHRIARDGRPATGRGHVHGGQRSGPREPFDGAGRSSDARRPGGPSRTRVDCPVRTGLLWDDGIIDPRDSRTVLGCALSAIDSAPVHGARGLRGVPDVTGATGVPGDADSCWWPTEARSPAALSAPPGPWESHRRRVQRSRPRGLHTVRPMSPLPWAASSPAESYLDVDDLLVGRQCGRAPTPFILATGSCRSGVGPGLRRAPG